jgi:hypothetical protein
MDGGTLRDDFRARLRNELVSSQQTRAALIRQKLVFIIGTLGLGTVSRSWHDSPSMLYLVPLIATVFDLYVAGEDFGVKRAGAYLSSSSLSAAADEMAWERFAEANRDHFSRIANPLASVLALLGAAGVLWLTERESGIYWLWLLGFLAVIGLVWTASHVRNCRIRTAPAQIHPCSDEAKVVRGGQVPATRGETTTAETATFESRTQERIPTMSA